jgi:hypothetical protein
VLVVIGQLLSRQLIVGAADYPVLGALGTDRRQLFWLAELRAGVVCTAGACVAVAIAVAASALMPIGPARLTAAGCPAGTCQALTAAQPAAISNDSRVRATPLVLGGLLALLAIALIGQALLTTIRRRRRDFAVVKTLGFRRWQVSAAVAWQATTLTAVALLAGLPLGVAGGRWAWALFAGSVGVGPGATVPLSAVLLTIPIALLVANTIAAGPAWAAAQIKPAISLRNE